MSPIHNGSQGSVIKQMQEAKCAHSSHLLVIEVDLLHREVTNLNTVRLDENAEIGLAFKVFLSLHARDTGKHTPQIEMKDNLRSIVLSYWFVVFDAHPNAFGELCRSYKPHRSTLAEIVLGRLDFAPCADGDVCVLHLLGFLIGPVRKAADLVSLFICKDGVCGS